MEDDTSRKRGYDDTLTDEQIAAMSQSQYIPRKDALQRTPPKVNKKARTEMLLKIKQTFLDAGQHPSTPAIEDMLNKSLVVVDTDDEEKNENASDTKTKENEELDTWSQTSKEGDKDKESKNMEENSEKQHPEELTSTYEPRAKTPQDRINIIIDAKEKIMAATTRVSGGKIVFNKADQKTVKEETEKMTKHLIAMALEIGKMTTTCSHKLLEDKLMQQYKETQQLKEQIQTLTLVLQNYTSKMGTTKRRSDKKATDTEQETGHETEQQLGTQTEGEADAESDWSTQDSRRRKKKTYATVTSQKTKNSEGWKTPELKEIQPQVTIRMGEEKDPMKIIRKIRSVAGPEERKGIKNIIPRKDGRVIIQYTEEKHKRAFTEAIKTKTEDLQIKTMEKQTPKITLTGITKGFTDEEIWQILKDENQDIEVLERTGQIEKPRLVARRNCRNEFKENVTLECTVNTFKFFVKKQKVCFDLMMIYIEEAISVALCYNCHRYGHVAKYCTAKPVCHKCGGEHRGDACQEESLDCPNCKALGFDRNERHHSARDRTCPIYRRREKTAQKFIDYGQTQIA